VPSVTGGPLAFDNFPLALDNLGQIVARLGHDALAAQNFYDFPNSK
jgi:hypothetical protein